MDITLSNHLCTVTSASEDEEEWLEDYLSISEPIFAKDYRSGRMVRKGTATHCFVKRGNFPAGFLRLVYKGAKREGYRLNITDQRVGASVEPCIPDYHVVYNFAEELALKKSGVARAWLRYYQMDALKAVIHRRRGIIWHPTGAGKCLSPDTDVMRYDGTLVKARDVVAGDQLMGPDSKRRNVLSTTTGTGDMYRIVPTKGKPWECNDVHVLTLVHTTSGRVIDIPLNEYLKKSKTFKHCYKLFQPERVDFAKACTNLTVDPYFIGVWLGDGTKDLRSVGISKPDIEIEQLCFSIAAEFKLHVRKDTHKPCPTYRIVTEEGAPNRLLRELRKLFQHSLAIPHEYLTARRNARLALLAGILDTDGHLANGYFEVVQKDGDLAKSIAFLARSLGFRVQEKVKCVNGCEYHRLTILGDVHLIPTRIPRKQAPDRNQKKNVLRTGFTVEKLGAGEYAGFTLDGDGRFLLGDFTVTHNTELAVALAQSINVKWLFIVQDKDLLYNAAERYEKRTGKKAGIIGDGKVELDVDGNFIVAMAQTLDRKRGDHELWEVVRTAEGLIIDECFPAGTLVDGKPIEDLRAGDQITSYNETTGRLETKRVARVMESTTNALVRLTLSDGRTIVCTPNHPLLTPTGWKPAGSLSGSLVLSSTHHAEEATNHQPSQVRNVWDDVHPRVPGLVRHQEEETQERLLHQNVCAQGSELRGVKEEPTHIRRDLSEDAYQEPDAQREDKGKDDGKPTSELSAVGTTSARRKRPWSYARGKEPIHCLGKCVDDAARCDNEEATRIRLSDELQDRPRTPSAEASSRSGRGIPQEPCTSGAGLKEREPTAWARVDRVEILQQGSRSGFERVCPGGKVYNIEVEDNHTYVVNGVVVHNCHQTPAKTIFQITQMSENAVYRVGLSGTPLDRGDQKGMATIGALGPIIHKVKSQELQNAGFLAEAIIEMLTYDHRASSAKTYQGAYGKDIVKNAKRNKLVIETMQRANKPNLTFVKQLNHGKELLKKAEKAGLRVEFVWGEASSSKRGELVKRLERGDLDCIICNVVWQQGIDIPSLASIIRASAGKSVISALQTIGRGTRVTEWKNRFQVFDIFDRLSQEEDEGEKDWFLKHSRARKRSYEREGHKVNVVDTRQLRLL